MVLAGHCTRKDWALANVAAKRTSNADHTIGRDFLINTASFVTWNQPQPSRHGRSWLSSTRRCRVTGTLMPATACDLFDSKALLGESCGPIRIGGGPSA